MQRFLLQSLTRSVRLTTWWRRDSFSSLSHVLSDLPLDDAEIPSPVSHMFCQTYHLMTQRFLLQSLTRSVRLTTWWRRDSFSSLSHILSDLPLDDVEIPSPVSHTFCQTYHLMTQRFLLQSLTRSVRLTTWWRRDSFSSLSHVLLDLPLDDAEIPSPVSHTFC